MFVHTIPNYRGVQTLVQARLYWFAQPQTFEMRAFGVCCTHGTCVVFICQLLPLTVIQERGGGEGARSLNHIASPTP
jgi:hypothetical protein